MYQHLRLTLALLLLLFTALACQAPSIQQNTPASEASTRVISSTESPLATPNVVVSILPTPTSSSFPSDVSTIKVEAGKAVVIGRLFSADTSQPITNTPVRLAEIYYAEEGNKDPSQGAWALDNAFSPFAYSDTNGFFIFENVEARDYVVFVGDILSKYALEVNEKGLPQPRTVDPDVVTDLGDLFIDY